MDVLEHANLHSQREFYSMIHLDIKQNILAF